jgi:hypothetical protein
MATMRAPTPYRDGDQESYLHRYLTNVLSWAFNVRGFMEGFFCDPNSIV